MTTGLLKKLIAGDRAALAFAITLVETQSKSKRALATELVQEATKVSTRSTCLRIAMTGAPGAGKSCLLERVGMELIKRGKKVAVLAIDPSSPTTKGSLLGDKTRMTELSRQLNAFVRPSPTNGWLGGVTRATGEATLFCELAGYDVIFVETVGVGQSEAAVSHVTDCCTMVLSPNAGDELQAMKRGVMELCDFFLVNKCDGDLVPSANRLKSELLSASKKAITTSPRTNCQSEKKTKQDKSKNLNSPNTDYINQTKIFSSEPQSYSTSSVGQRRSQ
ncbi:methylmalonic aciduria type A protein, mitochondrial-like isoform X2 [Convolutriloba macropyga]|uniref:methylmalonic aciduria type A protein, mitochondrial-like isoform X2 n=1 Tax=Convolutriloba macropyga TaxID=536237 RepID=UPI003F51B899